MFSKSGEINISLPDMKNKNLNFFSRGWLPLLILLIAHLGACANIGSALQDPEVITYPPVYDADDQYLGRAISFNYQSINVLNNKDYQYSISWSGGFFPAQLYFESTDCSGTPYLTTNYSEVDYIRGKTVYHNGGDFYRYQNIKSNGFLDVEANNLTFESYLDPQNADTNTTAGDPCFVSTTTQEYTAPVEKVSRSTVGIPSSLKGPLRIKD